MDTFQRSKLQWEETDREPHASTLAFHKRLLALRNTHPALQADDRCEGEAWAAGADAVIVRRRHESQTFLIIARLRGAGPVDLSPVRGSGSRLETMLTTEDPRYAPDPHRLDVKESTVCFQRSGAIILRVND